ncbi:MAG: YhfC family glutamic-type intramembrane protease, partial [Anaerolineae bacterium]
MPFILTTILIQLPLMILFPLLLGGWIRRRYGMGWGLFAAGALTFVASQVVHLPLNYALGLLGGGRGVALWPLPLMAVVAGLSAGVCEEGARWVALRFFLKRTRGWRSALQFGAGHGGGEAIIFGLLVLANFVTMLVLRAQGGAAL